MITYVLFKSLWLNWARLSGGSKYSELGLALVNRKSMKIQPNAD